MIPVLGGRYRLGPEIGSGGMGAVHRAWDERFDREVAIKILRAGSDAVERERLRREAQYLARLDHPNLVAVLDAGSDELRKREAVWFAMELVDGPDLRTVVRQDGPQTGAVVRRVLAGLLAALDALHTAGVVHRDLKPANVLLTAEPATGRWDVKLVDLGIAQHIRTDHLTSTGQIVGTAAYLSPEQVSGQPIGAATDVYALGLVAIEALTARIAFPGAPAESAVARLVRAPELPADIGPSWRAVLTAMTALDPAHRPTVAVLREMVERLPDDVLDPTAVETPTALLTALHEAPSLATAVLPRSGARAARARKPRRHLLVAAFLVLILAAAGGWVAALSGGPAPTAAAVVEHTPSAAATTPKPAPTVTVTAAAAVPIPTATTPSAAPPVPSVAKDSRDRVRKAWERRIRDLLDHQRPHH
ncbi:serine/threonine protein kinase [Amnibacterium kyonggiense]|uniref:non-specific serine/threonine protein kinase n=1 Tax=Amnibacterium kyonggiense TaxID=595671 RepID=A0A4R7FPW1_9MICO|nr:serine/threonine protein kinase [Amnibacterium kyonggiense]